MPLILAIEPDKRQASQVTAIVRGRLRAELVIGDSADRALAALGDRVPDLILTAALLPPKDETALDERLRSLNGTVAHVQTLTIPVLASGKGRGQGRAGSLLSALRRDKPNAAAPDGCDPAVFAEQCKEYLERAASDRELAANENAIEQFERPMATAAVAEPPAPLVEETFVPAVPEQEFEAVEADDQPIVTAIEEEPSPIVLPSVEADDAFALSQAFELPANPQNLANPANPQNLEHLVNPANPVNPAITLDPDEGQASLVAALALLEAEEPSLLNGPAGTAAHADGHSVGNGGDMLNAIDDAPQPTPGETELDSALPRRNVWCLPALENLANGSAKADTNSEPAQTPARSQNDSGSERTAEWVDIIEALRREAAPVKNQAPASPAATAPPAPAPPATAASKPADAATQAEAFAKRKRKRTSGSPAQDEWGFFDPDQCGFSALLAKLDEITEKDDKRGRTPRT